MTPHHKRIVNFQRSAILALIVSWMGGNTLGQEARPEQPKPGFTVVHLKAASADEVAQTISKLYADLQKSLRVVPDVRSNVLLIQGTPMQVAEITELIDRLDAAEDEKPKLRLQVFQLKFTDAATVVSLLTPFLGTDEESASVRISADARSNRVIVYGTHKTMAAVEDLIQVIDVEKNPTDIKVFSLRYRKPDHAILSALSLLCGENAQFSVDEEQNTVIVQGKPDTLNVIEAVLLRLDQRPAAAPSPNTYQLRVMWLVDGLQRDRVRKMPASLDDVVTELAKIDMANPSIVAQVVINTTGPFEAAGTAKLDRPCDLRISGSVQDGISAHGTEQARPKLQISIEASESLPNASNATVKMLCQLETTIKIPLKHYVVLGVTPVDSMNSAFVIQVLPMSSKSEIGAR
ncbi:MAG: secretin N-terminal domain-containing protein [Gammaproteobacteria bacterium]